VLGFALALRRRFYRTAHASSVVIGVELFLFAEEAGADIATAAFVGGTAGGCLLLATVAAWRASARAARARPGGLLAFLALASVWALMGGIEPFEYLFAAATVGLWWWFYYRRGAPVIAPGGLVLIGGRQRLLRLALIASFGLTLGAHLLLLEAAARNLTGPMLLAELRERGVYTVSDLTFARAMLADQYLWRDSVSSSVRVTAAHPNGLVRASRHERDRWSGSAYVWLVNLLEERKAKGYGVVIGEPFPGGWRVSYVHEGSPAHKAGMRRGDVIRALRAVDGIPVDQPDPTFLPDADSVRLELVSPGGEVRELTIVPGEYSRSAVSAEKVIEEAGRRVGYLELRHFLGTADQDFVDASARLRERGIDELVLDLRMNPGGRVDASRRVASAIGGKRLNGRVFQRLEHNERYRDRDRDVVFRTPDRGSLSLPRVFIITSEDTCSASEALINGLAPHMQV
jgi:hypothetical protein